MAAVNCFLFNLDLSMHNKYLSQVNIRQGAFNAVI